ncbi:UNVERIFIED_CONTAM: putative membrane protein YkvI [Acetivibrio alkalicellulosi]
MFGELRNILKVACIYIATIIGAGFASGREIIQFFTIYHSGGFYGIIMTGLLFAFIGYTILNKVYTERIRNYEEYLFPSVGWVLGWIMELVVTLFMISVFCIMISGVSGIVSDKFNIPFHHSIMYVTCICMIFFLLGIRSIVSLSTFITPILIVGILGIGVYIIIGKNTSAFNVIEGFSSATHNWFLSSILYVSYNSIISVVVMCSLLPYLKTRKIASIGGIMGGAILCGIVIVLNYVLYIFYPYVTSHELPVIGILDMYGELAGKLYRIILLLAMFISAITSGYGFIERISSKVKLSRKIIIPVICCLTIPMSTVGFSKLISIVYPIFGYLGMFMVFIILIQGLSGIFKTRWKSM